MKQKLLRNVKPSDETLELSSRHRSTLKRINTNNRQQRNEDGNGTLDPSGNEHTDPETPIQLHKLKDPVMIISKQCSSKRAKEQLGSILASDHKQSNDDGQTPGVLTPLNQTRITDMFRESNRNTVDSADHHLLIIGGGFKGQNAT